MTYPLTLISFTKTCTFYFPSACVDIAISVNPIVYRRGVATKSHYPGDIAVASAMTLESRDMDRFRAEGYSERNASILCFIRVSWEIGRAHV